VLVAAREDNHIARLHRRHRMTLTHNFALTLDEDVKKDDAFRFGHHGRSQHFGNRGFDRPRCGKVGREKHRSR
jgi:hypothetical protein